MAKFNTTKDCKKEIIASQNVTTIIMEDLLDALGVWRLAKYA
jgi:hypothetical protein